MQLCINMLQTCDITNAEIASSFGADHLHIRLPVHFTEKLADGDELPNFRLQNCWLPVL